MRRVRVLMLLWVLVLASAACGKKAPPRPPKPAGLAAVNDLRAEIDGGAVRLTWTLPKGSSGLAGFIIERSGPEKDTCRDCPRAYAEMQRLPVASGIAGLRHMDGNLPGKGRFWYRVIPFDVKDRKGAESNEVSVTIE